MREIKTIDCEKLDEELDQFIIDEKNLDNFTSNEAKFHLFETLERQYLKITPNTSVDVAFEILDALPVVAGQLSDNPGLKKFGKIHQNTWKLNHDRLADLQDTWFKVKGRLDDLRFDDWVAGLKVFHREGFESACIFLLNRPIVCIPKRATKQIYLS